MALVSSKEAPNGLCRLSRLFGPFIFILCSDFASPSTFCVPAVSKKPRPLKKRRCRSHRGSLQQDSNPRISQRAHFILLRLLARVWCSPAPFRGEPFDPRLGKRRRLLCQTILEYYSLPCATELISDEHRGFDGPWMPCQDRDSSPPSDVLNFVFSHF